MSALCQKRKSANYLQQRRRWNRRAHIGVIWALPYSVDLIEEENMRKSFPLAVAVITTVATVAFAQMAPTKTGDSTKGKVLTNDKGMTLYVFDKDSGGKSACNGPCAGNWSPLTVAAGAMPMGDYSMITRDDGSKQWAYKGRPLYTWKDDKKPGDITGDGFLNGAWHIAQP
jgi:predicted lipoprotein with Yx(FWY)xxD motif